MTNEEHRKRQAARHFAEQECSVRILKERIEWMVHQRKKAKSMIEKELYEALFLKDKDTIDDMRIDYEKRKVDPNRDYEMPDIDFELPEGLTVE